MGLDLITVLVVLVLAVLISFFVSAPAKSRLAEVGGIAFLIFLVVKLVAFLIGVSK